MIPDLAVSAPPGAAVATLARREAWRILRHPAYLVLLVYFLLLGGIRTSGSPLPARETVRELVTTLGLLWLGPATFVAANLVASSARRAHAESQLAAAPTTAQSRTLATCLGVLGPTAVAAGFAGVLWLLEHAGDTLPDALTPATLAGIPLCALGGGLLGIAAAGWLRWRGAPVVILLALVAWVVAVFDREDLRWTAPWTMTPDYFDATALTRGSLPWHAVYLLGLGLLAAAAALLKHPPYRRPLLAAAVVLGLGTLLAAWAQLP